MNFIDSLIRFLIDFIPLRVVRAFEQGVIEVFGKYKKTVGPGVYVHCKFVREVDPMTVSEQGVDCPTQPITTADDRQVSISCNISYEIEDAGKAHCRVYDLDKMLTLTAMNHIARVGRKLTFDRLQKAQGRLEASIKASLQRRVSVWGVRITSVGVSHFSEARPLHLLGDITKFLG